MTASGELAGTADLVRFALRRGRARMLLWVVGIIVLVVFSAASTKALFPTHESLVEAARIAEINKAAVVLNGPAQALDTIGGQVAFQIGAWGLLVVGLMSVFMVGFLTRAEEEAGRTELLLATSLGRHAPLAAALTVVTAMNVLVGVATAIGLIVTGLPTVGSIAFGVSFIAMGLVFMSIGAVAAQVTENTRVVYGASGALLALAFVLRAIGDVGDGTVSWLSPIGWSQKLRPYAGEQWWALAVPAAACAIQLALAWALTAHRDVGAGLVRPRPGPARASAALGGLLGLAFRLQRGSLIGWSVGVLLLGVSYGSIARDIEQFVADNEQLAEMFAAAGGESLIDSFFATTSLTLALIGSGFAVQSALRLRTEEAALRAEPLLATPRSRPAWIASHLTITALGVALVIVLGGLGTAVTYGATVNDFDSVPRLLGASLAYVPAAWVLAGVALALFGVIPRAAPWAWALFALALLVGTLADLLKLPDWLLDLSPFHHVPQLPAQDLRALPLILLCLVAAGLAATGLAGFRRRDTPA